MRKVLFFNEVHDICHFGIFTFTRETISSVSQNKNILQRRHGERIYARMRRLSAFVTIFKLEKCVRCI